MASLPRDALSSQAPTDRPPSAVSVFLAGLPERHGRVVTAASEIDSWKRKPAHVARRLQLERLERLWRAA